MFRTKRKTLLGLDIGSAVVKLVELDAAGRKIVVRTAMQSAIEEPADPLGDDGFDGAAAAAKYCLQAGRASGRKAACAVGGPEVAVRRFAFDSLEPEELAQAVRLEAAQSCPFDIDKSVVSYHVVEEGAKKGLRKRAAGYKGILVAASNGQVHQKERIADAAGMDCVVVDAEGLALLNCLEGCRRTPRDGTVVVVNVGSRYTNMVVTAPGTIPYMRDLPHAAGRIVHEIAAATGDSPAEILSVLRCQPANSKGRRLIEPQFVLACERLAQEIEDTVRFCQAEDKLPPVDEMLVCGGFALIDGFVCELTERVAARCELWNPFADLECSRMAQSLDLMERGPAFAIATGLAMRCMGDVYN